VIKPGDKLKGCQVIAAYRIKFDPSEKGGSSAVVGNDRRCDRLLRKA
jgi:hypothetical protein